MLSVRSARDEDVWPNGDMPPIEMRKEIRRVAIHEVSAEDVAGSSFSAWYAPYAVAEARVRARLEKQAERQQRVQVEEGANAKRIAALEKRLASIQKSMSAVLDLVGTKADGKSSEPLMFDVIRGLCLEVMFDRKVLRDCGIWDAEREYGPGAAVTHGGALYAAQQQHKGQRPGDGVCWRLTHKTEIAELRSLIRAVLREELKGKQ
jgi:hypothetical protein